MASAFARVIGLLVLLVVAQEPALIGQSVQAKLGTVLADLARAVPQSEAGGSLFDRFSAPIAIAALPKSVQDAAASRRLRFDSKNTVQVYILLTEATPRNVARLANEGVTVEIASLQERRVQARVPVRSLHRVAALPFVTFMRLPSYAVRHAGAVVTEGDTIHGAADARPLFGVDGTGVRVGVISDGIKGVFAAKCDSCSGVSGGPIASADLPDATGIRRDGLLTETTGGLTARSFRSDEDLEDTHSFFQPCSFRGAGAEGGALLEIVHDLAPGAQLSFANADTSLAFIEAVSALAADNDVVVDDLGFLGEPADGQSSVSRNTAAALNNPANRIRTYVTSVGNAANDHYFGAYVDSNRDARSIDGITTAGRMHLFQRTNETTDVLNLGDQPHDLISLPHNGEVVVVLTWNDVAGQSGNNYDLYLVDDDTGQVVARSTDIQRGSQDPLEAVDFLNRGDTGFFRIVVQNVGDQAAPRNLNLFSFQPQCAVDGPRRLATGRHERHNYNTATRSVLAQSDSGGSPVSAISVGAICSASSAAAAVFAGSDAPSESCNDGSHQTIQFYSSRGPTLDGRLKPDISAIDGVAITGAGRFPSPFFGTSAAAPHVAGIAALVLQAAPCLRSGGANAFETVTARTAVRNVILSTADSIGSPVPNQTFGSGLANAFRAVEAARAACPVGPEPPPQTPTPPPSGNAITINATVTHQTMVGWETHVLASIDDFTWMTDAQIATELDDVVNDVGFTRVRLAVRSGAENPTASYDGRYEIVNDNANPNVINPAGFHFAEQLDIQMTRVVMPMRQRVLARGLPFYINLNYVDFGQSAFEHYTNPAEYAEFMLAVFQHLQSRYGVVPNGIEVVLEPDNSAPNWNGTQIGQVMVATAARLQAAGFAVPEFIAPSTTALGNAEPWVNQIVAVSGAQALLSEISYHRYNTAADLAALGARAVQLGKRTSMLEWWTPSNTHDVLHEDLTVGRNSSWQQGAPLAGSNGCGLGAMLFLVPGPDPRRAELCPPTKFIRQYTKYVQPGARRIDAVSGNAAFAPVAFVNTNGRYVVIVKAATDQSFSVNGLPAGTYGIFYTTAADYNVQLPDVATNAGQAVTARIPASGVITIYSK
ncbi:MAG TPA: S8 family serine peptidase [Vicinamibacterales bacterium]|nr:S8 family serine peptidase [Vicinamibacterales bacterium]